MTFKFATFELVTFELANDRNIGPDVERRATLQVQAHTWQYNLALGMERSTSISQSSWAEKEYKINVFCH